MFVAVVLVHTYAPSPSGNRLERFRFCPFYPSVLFLSLRFVTTVTYKASSVPQSSVAACT